MNQSLLEKNLNDITEEEMRDAVKELIEYRKTSHLPNGVVRSLATRVAVRSDLGLNVAREKVTSHILHKAASLWANDGEEPSTGRRRTRSAKEQTVSPTSH